MEILQNQTSKYLDTRVGRSPEPIHYPRAASFSSTSLTEVTAVPELCFSPPADRPTHPAVMEQPPPPTSGAGGEAEDPFDDIVIPPDYLLELDVKVGGGEEEDGDQRLSLAYKGFSYVFDSVPPQKVM
jgi:hypothetical protein